MKGSRAMLPRSLVCLVLALSSVGSLAAAPSGVALAACSPPTINATDFRDGSKDVLVVDGQCFSPSGSVRLKITNSRTNTLIGSVWLRASRQGDFSYTQAFPCGPLVPLQAIAYDRRSQTYSNTAGDTVGACLGP